MRTLILFRHAKSGWDDPDLDDFDRPLAPRGTRAATRMGKWLKDHDLWPACVLCSTAVRARGTLTLALRENRNAAPNITFEDALYLAAPQTILDHVRALPDHVTSCMVVGHNPGLHALALELTGDGRKRDITQLAMKFPTAAIAHIVFEDEGWSRIMAATGRLATFVTPRGLADT